MVPNAKTSSSTLSEGRTTRLVYTPHTLAEAILVVGVTSPMRKILEACRWRLTSCEGGYVANDVGGLPLVLTIYLAVIVIITIGLGQGLPPVSHF